MTRRAAYLFVWGVAFQAMGIILLDAGGQETLWGLGFVFSGSIAFGGGISSPPILDTLGFVFLASMAAGRAVWHLIHWILYSHSLPLFSAVVLWSAVALAQIIVAGWPEAKIKRPFRIGEAGGVE